MKTPNIFLMLVLILKLSYASNDIQKHELRKNETVVTIHYTDHERLKQRDGSNIFNFIRPFIYGTLVDKDQQECQFHTFKDNTIEGKDELIMQCDLLENARIHPDQTLHSIKIKLNYIKSNGVQNNRINPHLKVKYSEIERFFVGIFVDDQPYGSREFQVRWSK